MKIILTGATGFLGTQVLEHCIKHMFITHIFVVSRKPHPNKSLTRHAKVTEIIHADFETWTPDELADLKSRGAEGCIWCIGGDSSRFKTREEAEHANVSTAIASAEAFAASLVTLSTEEFAEQVPLTQHGEELDPATARRKARRAPKRTRHPFRFIYMSVNGAEQNSFRTLWSNARMRHMKGAAEKGLFRVADQEAPWMGLFEVYALRLGRVLAGGQSVGNVLTEAVTWSVSAEKVGKMAIDTVLSGRKEDEGGRIVENGMILGDDWADINTVR